MIDLERFLSANDNPDRTRRFHAWTQTTIFPITTYAIAMYHRGDLRHIIDLWWLAVQMYNGDVGEEIDYMRDRLDELITAWNTDQLLSSELVSDLRHDLETSITAQPLACVLDLVVDMPPNLPKEMVTDWLKTIRRSAIHLIAEYEYASDGTKPTGIVDLNNLLQGVV